MSTYSESRRWHNRTALHTRTHQFYIALFCVLMLAPGMTFGQESILRSHPWSMSLAVGTGVGKSLDGVESMMKAGGYGENNPYNLWGHSGTVEYPHSEAEPIAGVLTVSRQLSVRTHLRMMIGHLKIGETTGYRGRPYFDMLILRQSVSTLAIMGGISDSTGLAWVAVGPAFHYMVVTGDEWDGITDVSASHVGLAGEVGATLKRFGRLSVQLRGQFRYVGTVNIGPIDFEEDGEVVGTLPKTGVNFNHVIVLLGLGVRL